MVDQIFDEHRYCMSPRRNFLFYEHDESTSSCEETLPVDPLMIEPIETVLIKEEIIIKEEPVSSDQHTDSSDSDPQIINDDFDLSCLSDEDDEEISDFMSNPNTIYIDSSTSESESDADECITGVGKTHNMYVGKNNPASNKFWIKNKFKVKPWAGPFDPTKLDKPEPILTPLQYFSKYFNENFFNDAATYTNIYSEAKTGKSLNTDASELKRFFGLNLLMGCVPYPRLRIYWSRECGLPVVIDCMSCNRFLSLRNNFQVVNVNKSQKKANLNNLWKVQPIIDSFKDVSLKLPQDSIAFCIDEQTILAGNFSVKQQIDGKNCSPKGLKIYLLMTSYGLVLDFEICEKTKKKHTDSNLGFRSEIVLKLVKSLPSGSHVFFDQCFSSIPLLQKLCKMNLECSCKIGMNKVSGIRFSDNANLKTVESEEYVSYDGKIVVVRCNVIKNILMASTCFGIEPEETINKWSKQKRKNVGIKCPSVFVKYNKCMNGVKIQRQLMGCYRNPFRAKRWTLKLIIHFIDLAVVNAWILYNRHCESYYLNKKSKKDILSFKLEIAEALMATSHLSKSTPFDSEDDDDDDDDDIIDCDKNNDDGESYSSPNKKTKYHKTPSTKLPCFNKRYDGYEHYPSVSNLFSSRRCRLKSCRGRTKTKCEKCDVYLCLLRDRNCFKSFHCKP